MSEIRIPIGSTGATFCIEIDTAACERSIEATVARTRDMGPLLKRIATIMRQGYGEQFSAGGDPMWKPLARSTVAAKISAGLPARTAKGRIPWRLKQRGAFGPGNILIASGALRDSYRRMGAKGHVERIDASAGTVEVGSDLKTAGGANLAAIHQYGTSPYTIRPRLAKALAFRGASGEDLFRRVVHHPGLTARPVRMTAGMKTAIDQAINQYFAGQQGPDVTT